MNKKGYLLIALVTVFSLGLWSGHSFAQNNEWVKGTVEGYCQSTGWNGIEAGQLIGHKVYSPTGGDLGQISNVLVDRANGRIAMVILSSVPGFTWKYVAAPFGALQRTGEDVYQLNFSGRDVPLAPSYFEDRYAYELERFEGTVGLNHIPSAIDPLWANAVYQFYGMAPYWSGGKKAHLNIMVYRAAETMPSLEGFFGSKVTPGLIGSMVQSRDGKATARIDDLVIDSKDQRVALLVLDEVSGRSDAQVAIPFGELSMRGEAFVLNITTERLATAPSFKEFADVNNPQYAARVFRYFGLQPSWTKGGRTTEDWMLRRILDARRWDHWGERPQGF